MNKYIWQSDDFDGYRIFDSIEEAFESAEEYLESPCKVWVFDCRPATDEDKFLFEGGENQITGEIYDTESFGWFNNKWVPENVVESRFIAPKI
jgi:hypothetical protein